MTHLESAPEVVQKMIRFAEKERGVEPDENDRSTCYAHERAFEELAWFVRDGKLLVDMNDHDQSPEKSTTARFRTTDEAWHVWSVLFYRYMSSHSGVICWRIRPEIGEVEDDVGGFRVYARLHAAKF